MHEQDLSHKGAEFCIPWITFGWYHWEEKMHMWKITWTFPPNRGGCPWGSSGSSQWTFPSTQNQTLTLLSDNSPPFCKLLTVWEVMLIPIQHHLDDSPGDADAGCLGRTCSTSTARVMGAHRRAPFGSAVLRAHILQVLHKQPLCCRLMEGGEWLPLLVPPNQPTAALAMCWFPNSFDH